MERAMQQMCKNHGVAGVDGIKIEEPKEYMEEN